MSAFADGSCRRQVNASAKISAVEAPFGKLREPRRGFRFPSGGLPAQEGARRRRTSPALPPMLS
jgi:hypothetical protein